MHINVGDKLVVTKNMSGFFNEGDIVEVTGVSENMVSFACYNTDTEDHIRIARSGQMDIDTCNQYFAKVEEEEEEIEILNIDVDEIVEEIMGSSEFEIQTAFDKCAIVSCKLPNGFVIVESALCMNEEEYDEETYSDICFDKIAEKIFELESYRILENMRRDDMEEECFCNCCECDEYPYDDEFSE